MTTPPIDQLRTLCLGLPDAREVEAWGAPTFRVKTIFAMYSDDGSHGTTEGPAVWVKALQTNQDFLVGAAPTRFFVPPYVGPKGWIGVRLDAAVVDWEELKDLLWDAWRMSVPKSLLTQHPEPPAGW